MITLDSTYLLRSTDGINWDFVTESKDGEDIPLEIVNYIYLNDKFIGIFLDLNSHNFILYESINGLTWTPILIDGENLIVYSNLVKCNDKIYFGSPYYDVTLCYDGNAIESIDLPSSDNYCLGENLIYRYNSDSIYYYDVNTKLSSESIIPVSDDFENINSFNISQLTYNNGVYLALIELEFEFKNDDGESEYESKIFIYRSEDLINWTKLDIGELIGIYLISSIDNLWILMDLNCNEPTFYSFDSINWIEDTEGYLRGTFVNKVNDITYFSSLDIESGKMDVYGFIPVNIRYLNGDLSDKIKRYVTESDLDDINKNIDKIPNQLSNYVTKDELPPQITVDTELSETSENPVQNKVVKSALDNKVNNNDTEVVIGRLASAIVGGIAIGAQAKTTGRYGAVAIGLSTIAGGEYAIAIGRHAEALANYSVAIAPNEAYNNLAYSTYLGTYHPSGRVGLRIVNASGSAENSKIQILKSDSVFFEFTMQNLKDLFSNVGVDKSNTEVWKGNVGFGEQDTFIGAKKTNDGDGQFQNGYPRLHNHGQDIHEVSGFSRDSREDETVWSHRLLLPWDLAKANDTSYLMAGVIWESTRLGVNSKFVQPLLPTNTPEATAALGLPYAVPCFENSPIYWNGHLIFDDGAGVKQVQIPWEKINNGRTVKLAIISGSDGSALTMARNDSTKEISIYAGDSDSYVGQFRVDKDGGFRGSYKDTTYNFSFVTQALLDRIA
jgi:hypothetical protein